MRAITVRWKWIVFLCCLFAALFLILRYYLASGCVTDYKRQNQLKTVLSYCNSPEIQVSGAEGRLSTGYHVVSVHMVIRHGDRYALHSLPGYQTVPVSCRFSSHMLQRYPVLSAYLKSVRSSNGQRKAGQTFHAWSTYPDSDVCELGRLTPTGAVQHLQNGHFLRIAYQNLQLNHTTHVMVRSTFVSRTYQSAIALMAGLVPALQISSLTIQKAYNNSLCTLDTRHSCHCPGIQGFADTMANGMQITHTELRKRAKAVYQQMSELLPIDLLGGPTLSRIMDVSMIHACHSVRLPGDEKRCMRVSTLKEVFDILQHNGRLYSQNSLVQKVARLKMQPLLSEISNRMAKQLLGENNLKFVLYSGHDTSIDSLAIALNISDGHWPRYAARIVLELVSSAIDNKFYIRVLYDGEVVTHKIHFCQGHIIGEELDLCPFNLFLQYVKRDYLTKMNASSYKEACETKVL